MTPDQKRLVRLALSKLKAEHERKRASMCNEYETEKARLEAMLCQNYPSK